MLINFITRCQYYYYKFGCGGSYRSCYEEIKPYTILTILAYPIIYILWVKNLLKSLFNRIRTEEDDLRDEINTIKRKLNKIEERESLEKELKDLKIRLDEKKKK